jgi:peptide-methionine (S)-S-oxide reductase
MKPVLLALTLAMSATVLATAESPNAKTETATIGGGCFWCVEAQYKLLPGVLKVISGYSGGHKENPTYEEVCEKTTGHAEVVQVEFDPAKVSYKEIIDLFWEAHDPTTLNRQGNDEGPQYRSIILYHNEEQKKIAEASKLIAQKGWKDPIVTEIVPLKKFYVAEAYHQNFSKENPMQGYVRAVVTPKVEKFKHKLEEKGKEPQKP